MKFLLDVNVLVAWGWKDHSDHAPVVRWIARERGRPGTSFLSSPIPGLGFVRVSVQRSAGQISVADAADVLAGMFAALGNRHEFLPDNRPAKGFPPWCRLAAQTTDAHLRQLADSHGAKLATLDHGIPGAFVVPVG